eukprot:15114595-Alexandrium_andersonii.AAC.1
MRPLRASGGKIEPGFGPYRKPCLAEVAARPLSIYIWALARQEPRIAGIADWRMAADWSVPVSYTHLRAHETSAHL